MLTLRTGSIRRYRIEGRLPSPHGEEFLRRLQDRRFLPLKPKEEKTHGWVSAENLLVTDFPPGSVERGAFVVFALRLDRRRVHARLLRAHLDLEVRARRKAAADGAGAFRLSRDERQQMRHDLHAELLGRTNPTIDVHTVLLHPKRRILYFTSLARPANLLLRALFQDTFGVELVPLTPWRRSSEVLAGSEVAPRLDALERAHFDGVRRVASAPAPTPVEIPR